MSKRKIEELEKLLEEERREKEAAKAREEEAKTREEEAKTREEKERREKEAAKAREEEAKAREKEAKVREEEERRKNQNTTLSEYLYNCHFDLYQKLRLARASRSSTGFATSVEGRYYPRWLRPWRDFTDHQRHEHFTEIVGVCGEGRPFHQRSTTRDIGMSFEDKEAGYENAIDHFEKSAVEDPTWNILKYVLAEEGMRQKYQSTRLRFANGLRDFNDLGGDIGAKIQAERGKQQPDGCGIRADLNGIESAAFMYDYKAAHKFAVRYLEAALAKETLFMDIHEWTRSERYNTDSMLNEQEREEARIAMALIQVFNYMLLYGVGYGYVTAGKCLVFLYYDQEEPLVLRWHLCMPAKDVALSTTGAQAGPVSQTAVAQLASFCLLSLCSPALTGRALEEAVGKASRVLKKWKEEDHKDPDTPPGSHGPGSSSAPPSGSTDRSFPSDGASPTGRDYPRRSKASCKNFALLPQQRDDDKHSGQINDVGPGFAPAPASAPTRQYCTQTCLLGLKLGLELDSKCPNIDCHRVGGNARHAISAKEFTDLMGEQLRQDPYQGCDALIGRRKFGSTGVLFKLELAQLGYTLVGKGTVSKRPSHLEHECSIYERLDGLQGEVVPVHLGMVSLALGHLLPGGARVIHMMMMSWGGELAANAMLPNLKLEVQRSIQAISMSGVYHGDEREPNLLWNSERGRVMVIDFDCAVLLPAPKPERLSALFGGRKRKGGDDLKSRRGKRSQHESLYNSVGVQ